MNIEAKEPRENPCLATVLFAAKNHKTRKSQMLLIFEVFFASLRLKKYIPLGTTH